ncbi:chromosome partition protein Smc [Borrelia hermsii DAH]|uniref:Chromosome partition protein Smc n=1 Tax=Borrelia hermsii (strain HS1 / DAH) TaxID=314723 RepID=A0AA34R3E6_BORHD|nr:chromosome partition protein Smc [Borrelia hermsii DAH]
MGVALFLEKIGLLGFKSFVKMQELKLNSSLNFIVGPNGCGKSNLLDAIRFCIGEDNLSILRVKYITDLISAAKSGESNFAEVTLFFNNEDLSVSDFRDRFYIRRRLYKDGTSEYFLNDDTLNLKSYMSLINKLRLKNSPYMFINQGKIERISSSGNINLKSLIEEASGIDMLRVEEEQAYKRLEKSKENLNSLWILRDELNNKYEKIKNDFLLKGKYQNLKKDLEALEKNLRLKKLFNINFELNELKSKLDIKDIDKILSLNSFSIESVKEKLEFYSFREKNVIKNIEVIKKEIETLKSKLLEIEIKIQKLEHDRKGKLNLANIFMSNKAQIESVKVSINEELMNLNNSLQAKKKDFFDLTDEINRYTRSFFEIIDLVLSISKESNIEEFELLKKNIFNALKSFEDTLSIKYIKEIRENLLKYIVKEDKLLNLLKEKIEPIFEQNVDLRKFLLSKNNSKASLAKEITTIEALVSDKTIKLNEILGEIEYTELSRLKNEDEIKLIDSNLKFLFETRDELMERLNNLNLKLDELSLERSDINVNLDKFLSEAKGNELVASNEINSLNLLDAFKNSSYYEYMKKQAEYDVLFNSSLDIEDEIKDFNRVNKNLEKFELTEDMAKIDALQKEINVIEHNNYIFFNVEREYNEIKEKVEKIGLQIDDLNLTKESLNKLRRKIKREIDKRFNDAFGEINNHFIYFFSRMFKGNGSLFYDKDLGEIEIKINFKDKLAKRNKMLSGGEHSLISIVFLFALYYYSPASFCVLDEIDASLDFENSNKLSGLLKELGQKVQLLIITHNMYVAQGSKNLIGVTSDNGESVIFNI